MLYLIDSCCLITPHRFYAPMDVALSFWKAMAGLCSRDDVHSIDKVQDEIYTHDDSLKAWCEQNINKEDFFLHTDTSDILSNYAKLSNWVNCSLQYNKRAKDEFLAYSHADAWLVAYAMQNTKNTTIVTQETSDASSHKHIKLPDACAAQNVRSIDFVAMMRELGIAY